MKKSKLMTREKRKEKTTETEREGVFVQDIESNIEKNSVCNLLMTG
jgi:hypothetical protein